MSTSGAQLLPEEAVQRLLVDLLPLTTVLTPNVPEAKSLLAKAGSQHNADPRSVDDLIELAKQVHALGPQNVLLKGGHLPLPIGEADSNKASKTVYNVLVSDATEPLIISYTFLGTKSTHGTGCSLACKCFASGL